MVKWHRRERGSYIGEIEGVRVTIVNMKGDGPNAPEWQGPIPAWEIRIGGEGDYDIGAVTVHTAWGYANAREWVIQNHQAIKRGNP